MLQIIASVWNSSSEKCVHTICTLVSERACTLSLAFLGTQCCRTCRTLLLISHYNNADIFYPQSTSLRKREVNLFITYMVRSLNGREMSSTSLKGLGHVNRATLERLLLVSWTILLGPVPNCPGHLVTWIYWFRWVGTPVVIGYSPRVTHFIGPGNSFALPVLEVVAGVSVPGTTHTLRTFVVGPVDLGVDCRYFTIHYDRFNQAVQSKKIVTWSMKWYKLFQHTVRLTALDLAQLTLNLHSFLM